MTLTIRHLIWLTAVACLLVPVGELGAAAPDAPEYSAEQLEFFEKKIRPLLVNSCYKCHGPDKEEPDGGLRLHSRAWMLEGGDSGPAIEPGKPEASLLIEAVKYEGFEMPPRNPLPEDQIALLETWIQQGAAWPPEAEAEIVEKGEFPLWERKESHWAWSDVKKPAVPKVKQADWPQDELDHFILAKLEQAGLPPAPQASRRTLIRRAYFDLVGLPPTPQQVESFVNDPAPTREAFAKVVDELLASPHYGERWARHWMDLVRFGETRGHEFDPIAPNAWQYRDYLIRALNADVPYNEFVIEHIAGDLVDKPRLNPESGFNESVLATGFWFLNEQVHSPVDIRHDEVERMDNMVDVATKSFMGLTVSCARCHDHKFDAISTKDYYSFHGYLQSSRYVQTRFDSMEQNKAAAQELAQLRDDAQRELKKVIGQSIAPVARQSGDYLLAAREVLLQPSAPRSSRDDRIVADFESGTYDGWTVTGEAFGDKPQTLETIASYQGRINAVGKYFVNSHNVRPQSGDGDKYIGTMLSDEFTVDRDYLTMLVGGGADANKTCVNLHINGKVVRTATGRNDNQMSQVHWDVREFAGKQARLEIVDDHQGGWGNIGLDHVVLTDRGGDGPTGVVRQEATPATIEAVASARKLDATLLAKWTTAVTQAGQDAAHPLHFWAKVALDAKSEEAEFAQQQAAQFAEQRTAGEAESADTNVVIDYTRPSGYYGQEGHSFHLRPRVAGDVEWGKSSDRPIEHLHTVGGAYRDAAFFGLTIAGGTEQDPGKFGYYRAGRTLHTPTFDVDQRPVWLVVQGKGRVAMVVDSHRVVQGPLHGGVVRDFDTGGKVQAVRIHLPDYAGHNAHLEITPDGDNHFVVLKVVQSETSPPIPSADAGDALAAYVRHEPPASLVELARRHQALFMEVAEAMQQNRLAEGDQAPSRAVIADWIVQSLPQFGAAMDDPRIKEIASSFLARQEAAAAKIVRESRTAMGMMDGSGVDEHVLIRGSHKNIGEPAPRQMLVAIAGEDQPPPKQGSGRLELARRMVDPGNPFASRVIVNRLWHHMTGRGIVQSVDNFGVLGQEPTHPELLDHLAVQFMEQGWSQKQMLRQIMLSSTYMMSSKPEASAEKADPANLLLHRMRIRRLQGEVIRDSMLAVSGRLNPSVGGRPVEVHLTEFMTGRGRPGGSGPLDGDGRRSVYIKVRRNFLSPMMIAFDTPIPFNAVGQRNTSNVPAQALILMNDPFVVGQAERWAKQVLADGGADVEDQIENIYLQGLGRVPSDMERTDAYQFLKEQAELYGIAEDKWPQDPRVWTDLCHVVFNLKEFIYID